MFYNSDKDGYKFIMPLTSKGTKTTPDQKEQVAKNTQDGTN